MAINYCTLTGSTLDSFCGNRRAIVLATLLDKKYPPPIQHGQGGSPRVLRDTFVMPPPFEFEDRPTLKFEQPWITVEVEFDGKKGVQTLDNDAQQHFVAASDLEIEAASDISVEVSDMTEVEIAVNITDFEI